MSSNPTDFQKHVRGRDLKVLCGSELQPWWGVSYLKPLAEGALEVGPVGLKGHCWRSKFIQHFPKGGVNQKHSGGKTGWPLSHCAGQRRRERGFPWHCGPNTIPSLSTRQIAAGGQENSVAVYLCGCFVGSLNNKCWATYLPVLSCSKSIMSFNSNKAELGRILKYANTPRHHQLYYKLFIFISAPGDLRA